MAKFIVTSGSHFRPFTYDDMAKPLQQMTEAHNAAADAYDQLSMETAALKNYISTDGKDDEMARQMYQGYVDKLDRLQNNLWQNGVTVGTRRDLSAARTVYASDILRLQKAIETRQERSKEYWDARHKDPDLVAGYDPSTSGLDNYLNDTEYGRNWFSYSGTQFANEVAADLKARANDLQQSYISRGLGVPGYLEYVVKNGFSNADINGGAELARRMLAGDNTIQEGEYDAVQILVANSLLNNIQRTGANPAVGGNITSDEFSRLFNYGVLGATQSILPDDRKPMDDKLWDLQQKYALEGWKHALSGSDVPQERNVHREPIAIDIEAPGAGKAAQERNSVYNSELYANGNTVPINLPGGGVAELRNPDDVRSMLMSDEARKFNSATGMDVTKNSSDWWKTNDSKQIGTYRGAEIRAEKASPWDWLKGGVGIGDTVVKQKVNGKWVYHAGLTQKWNDAEKAQQNYERQIEQLNPGKTVTNLGLTSKEAQKIRKDNPQIPAGVSDSDLLYVLRSEKPIGEYLSVPIVLNNDDNFLREDFANGIMLHFDQASGEGYGKTDKNGFYRIGQGNVSADGVNELSKKGGLSNVFELQKNGKIDPECIIAIHLLPQDIKDGKVKVRVQTTKGKFITDISTLGQDMTGAMNPLVASVVESALLPMSRTADVLDRNSNTGLDWDSYMWQTLYAGGYGIPYIAEPGAKPRPAYADEVARNTQLQKQVLDGLQDYLIDALSFGIDPKTLHPLQHKGYTSEKATGIYNR